MKTRCRERLSSGIFGMVMRSSLVIVVAVTMTILYFNTEQTGSANKIFNKIKILYLLHVCSDLFTRMFPRYLCLGGPKSGKGAPP
jgi:hypothetical protein